MDPKGLRPGSALILAAASLAAVCWVSSIHNDSIKEGFSAIDAAMEQINNAIVEDSQAETPPMTPSDKAMDDIYGMVEAGHASKEETVRRPSTKDKVHQNIVALKAYSVAVHDKLKEMLEHKHSSVVPFIREFGKNGKNKNVIMEFSQLFAKMSNQFKSGMGLYMLQHLNRAILTGNGVVAMKPGDTKHYILDYSTMGLESLPEYFYKLRVKISRFEHQKEKVKAINTHAASEASAALLQGKHQEAYDTFLDRELAKVKKYKLHLRSVYEAALKAEKIAYTTSVEHSGHTTRLHAAVQARAGVPAAVRQTAVIEQGVKQPSREELNAAAKAAADSFMDKMTRKNLDAATLIKKLQAEQMGVKLSITTAEFSSADSAMQPKIIIKGTRGSLSTVLKSLPAKGKTRTHVLPSDHALGNLVSVKFISTDTDSWMCQKVSVEMGTEGKAITLHPETALKTMFWLDSAKGGTNYQGYERSNTWTLSAKSSGKSEEEEPMLDFE
jgi:hypothetical protein